MNSPFPKDFLWGAATAAHQVEGNTYNQWTVWEHENAEKLARDAQKTVGKFDSWERVKEQAQNPENYLSGKASGSYGHFLQDFDMLESMNMNAYRFSVEWSRIEPDEGNWNQDAIEHYKAMLIELERRGITPNVTLFHFTLPVWFAKKGGFEKRKNVHYFSRYARKIAEELGAYVPYFITVNEPEVYSSISYISKMWPPARMNPILGMIVQNNLAVAHNEAAIQIKEVNPTLQISVAKHSINFYSNKHTWYNRAVINVLQYIMDDMYMKKVATSCDFIGINFYQSIQVSGLYIRRPKVKTNDLRWAMRPADIEQVLVRFHKKYQKPLIVTENGVADGQDTLRKWWIEESLRGMSNALNHGVELKGYFHWSLIDNFEWSYGKWPRFGLVSYDKDFNRSLKPSAVWFGTEIKKYR